jgi:hypothetical protein
MTRRNDALRDVILDFVERDKAGATRKRRL